MPARSLPPLLAVLVAAGVALAGCGLPLPSPGAGLPHAPTRVVPGSAAGGATASSGPSPVPPLTPALARAALSTLDGLPVKGRAPKTGYDRDAYGPAWSDDVDVSLGHNGCDTRNDVLRRDLVAERLKPGTHGCVVVSGTLADPYTGRSITFVRGRATSAKVQIDHVVALGDAWVTGAQQLTATERRTLANDPLNLLAVDGPTNSAKRDADAASWLPPNKAYRCTYVARQVAVKSRYRLWVTAAEKAQIARVLAGCSRAR
nr:HNH endonuclease family protein [Terrabacter sp. Soil811]